MHDLIAELRVSAELELELELASAVTTLVVIAVAAAQWLNLVIIMDVSSALISIWNWKPKRNNTQHKGTKNQINHSHTQINVVFDNICFSRDENQMACYDEWIQNKQLVSNNDDETRCIFKTTNVFFVRQKMVQKLSHSVQCVKIDFTFGDSVGIVEIVFNIVENCSHLTFLEWMQNRLKLQKSNVCVLFSFENP